MSEETKDRIRHLLEHIYNRGLSTFEKDTNPNEVLIALVNIILRCVANTGEAENFEKVKLMFTNMCDQVAEDFRIQKQNDENDAIRSEIRRIETEMEPQDDKAN